MEEASLLLRHGCYAAAGRCLPDPEHWGASLYPPRDLAVAGYLRRLSRFYGGWQAGSYLMAAEAAPPQSPPGAGPWADLAPSRAAVAWVQGLAETEPEERSGRLGHGKRLAVELVARSAGALDRDRLNEAVHLGYAARERIIRTALLAHGLDTQRLPATNPIVCQAATLWPEHLRVPNSGSWQTGVAGARRLLSFADPTLARAVESTDLAIFQRRNYLPDTHGTESISDDFHPAVRRGIAALEILLERIWGDSVREELAIARTPDRLHKTLVAGSTLGQPAGVTPEVSVTIATFPHPCVLN